MKILGRADSSNVRKVLWAIDELGLAAEREDCGGPFGGTDTPEYLAMNPPGLVPTLVDGGVAIWESNTIIRYLATRAPERAFCGHDAASAARVSQWMDWQLGTLAPPLQTIFIRLIRLGVTRDDELVRSATETLTKLFNTVLASSLPSEGFLLGAKLSAADVGIGVMLYRYTTLLGTEALDERVVTYYQALSERSGFKKHVAIGKP